ANGLPTRKPSRSKALAALVRPSSSRHVSSCGWAAVRARRAPFAANRASTPRAQWRSPQKINRLAQHQLGVQMLQRAGSPGKALAQGVLDGAEPIGATEITFDIGDKAIEWELINNLRKCFASKREESCSRARRGAENILSFV